MSFGTASKPIKLYPSSVAFMSGDLVVTEYSSGCLRYQLLASEGLKEPFDPKHARRGKINEERYESAIIASGLDYQREVPFKIPVADDAYISGRIDFTLSDTQVHECKSSESPNVVRQVLKEGKLKKSNVAQLVTYLMAAKIPIGRLIYSAYKPDKNNPQVYIHIADRVFEVTLGAEGEIYVDGKKYEFGALEIVAHFLASAGVIRDRRIVARPYNYTSFDGPCKYCVFRDTCGLYDESVLESVEDFIESAKLELQRRGKEKKND